MFVICIEDVRYLDKIKRFPDISKRQKIEDKFLEREEFLILTKEMNVESWRLLTLFLGLSGMRIGEAIALTDDDVDFKNNTIYITKTYDYVNEETTSPKTYTSTREIHMQPELKEVARHLQNYMMRQRLMYGYEKQNLFLQNEKGHHIQYWSYNKYIKENALRILKRPKVTPHILRHTHTCLLAERGIPLETITRRLGHSDSTITKRVYLHVTKKMKEQDNLMLDQASIL